jgi:HEPN domain-containing protein
MSVSLPAIPIEDVVMNLVQISDWREFIEDGEKYLRTAIHAAKKRREVFTPEILYNLTAMAIEKYLMGFLMYHGDMADNHTMRDLIESVERHVNMQPDLAESLLYLDSFQEICDLETYNRRAPSIEEIAKILAIGQDIKGFVAGLRNG